MNNFVTNKTVLELDSLQQILTQEYFNVVKNKTVLEIGPLHGIYTELLQEKIPSNLSVVEPDRSSAKQLRRLLPEESIICQDIHHYLEQEHKFDVVVCFF